MKIFLPKWLIKVCLSCAIFAILALAILLVSGKIFFSRSKTDFQESLSEFFIQAISIEDVGYRVPNIVVLKDVFISTNEFPKANKLFFAEDVRLEFSLKRFIEDKEFIVTGVHLRRAYLDSAHAAIFVRESSARIKHFFASLPKGIPLEMTFHDMISVLKAKDNLATQIVLDSELVLKDELVSSRGAVGVRVLPLQEAMKPPPQHKQSPLVYKFVGFLNPGGVIIENLELEKKTNRLKLWGAFNHNLLTLNGFALLKEFPHKDNSVADRFSTIRVIEPSPGLNIFDFNCVVHLVLPHIGIERISFTLNDIPLSLTGNIFLLDPASVRLTLSSYPDQEEKLRLKNPKRFDLSLAGTLREEKFCGEASFDFLRQGPTKLSYQRIEADLIDLAWFTLPQASLRLKAAKTNLLYRLDKNIYKIPLSDSTMLLNFADKRFKFIECNSRIFDGSLTGYGAIDLAQVPLRSVFNLAIEGISANKLGSVSSYFSKVYGELSSQIHYSSHPNPDLSGHVVINQGYLDHFDFFQWLANFFSIEELNKLNFDSATANFSVDDEVASLKNIKLDAHGLTLDGYFDLRENDLISGKISLTLSKKLLENSSRFRALARFLDKDSDALQFEFQLSGISEAMNFKWSESNFKRRLQAAIPDFIERGIERKVEMILESFDLREK